ncbi:hypothetical protein MASR1M59_08980 [Melaminivora sp.]
MLQRLGIAAGLEVLQRRAAGQADVQRELFHRGQWAGRARLPGEVWGMGVRYMAASRPQNPRLPGARRTEPAILVRCALSALDTSRAWAGLGRMVYPWLAASNGQRYLAATSFTIKTIAVSHGQTLGMTDLI